MTRMPPPEGPPARLVHASPRLRVAGRSLVSGPPGAPRVVRLRGLNRSGLQHKPGLAQAGFGAPPDPRAEFALWRDFWGADLLRLPLALDRLTPDSAYERDVDELVDAAEAVGLYLLLELHGLCDDPHPPLPPEDETRRAWMHLARRYGPRPHVLFDLWNEPHPETLLGGPVGVWRRAAWELWREAAQGLIDVVRDAGAGETLIVVGGIDWAYDLAPLRAPRLRLHGRGPLAYATHVYPFKGRARTHLFGRRREWQRAFGDVAAELPVLVTEFGAAPGSAADAHFPGASAAEAHDWLCDLLAYVDELGLSALAWSAGDRPHLVQALGGGEPLDLGSQTLDARAPSAPFGRLVRAWLRGEPLRATVTPD